MGPDKSQLFGQFDRELASCWSNDAHITKNPIILDGDFVKVERTP